MTDRNPFDTLRENPFEDEQVTIKGRTFEVDRSQERTIILKGRRGATYVLVPFVNDRTRLHVVAWGGHAPFPGVVLTDTPTGLEVSR
jgi:hypothetical protein